MLALANRVRPEPACNQLATSSTELPTPKSIVAPETGQKLTNRLFPMHATSPPSHHPGLPAGRSPASGAARLLAILMLAGPGLCIAPLSSAADAAAAQSLAQKSGCFKCHGVDKSKDGPALRDAAAKYRGDSQAQQRLIFHVTSGEKVKFSDGHEEEHKKVKTSDPNETRNLVDWILSLEGGTKY